MNENLSIDEKINICVEKIRSATIANKGKKRFESKQPWFVSQCENLRRKMLAKLDIYRSTDADSDRLIYNEHNYSKFFEEKKILFCNGRISMLNSVKNSSDW